MRGHKPRAVRCQRDLEREHRSSFPGDEIEILKAVDHYSTSFRDEGMSSSLTIFVQPRLNFEYHWETHKRYSKECQVYGISLRYPRRYRTMPLRSLTPTRSKRRMQ
jgi:hypothetical protein